MSIEHAKTVGDVIAIPTGFAAAITALLGIAHVVVGILAGTAALVYTVYRIYDLRDQRRARRAASQRRP